VNLRKDHFSAISVVHNVEPPISINIPIKTKVLPVDTLVAITMTNAAKRDSNCELHDLVNHHNFECTLRSSLLDHTPLSVYTNTLILKQRLVNYPPSKF
jgi:hypothetical protein